MEEMQLAALNGRGATIVIGVKSGGEKVLVWSLVTYTDVFLPKHNKEKREQK